MRRNFGTANYEFDFDFEDIFEVQNGRNYKNFKYDGQKIQK